MPVCRRSWYGAGLAAVVVFGCSVKSSPPPAATPFSEEDRVVGVVLDSLFSGFRNPKLLVRDRTMRQLTRDHLPARYWEELRQTRGVTPEMLAAFEAANRSPRQIASLSAEQKVVEVVSDSTIEAVVRGHSGAREYWRRIYDRFPGAGAIVRLSRVGFSAPGLDAVVEVNYGCGALCGMRAFVVASKQGGEWRVIEVHTTLVS